MKKNQDSRWESNPGSPVIATSALPLPLSYDHPATTWSPSSTFKGDRQRYTQSTAQGVCRGNETTKAQSTNSVITW